MMNPLQSRLAALRRHLRVVVTFRGVCWLATIALTTAALSGVLDWCVPHHLPSLVRALILVSALGGAGCVGYRFLARPLGSRLDDLSLAIRVENFYPALNDSLASAVEFLEQPQDSEQSGSPGLRQAVVQRTLRHIQDYDFERVVSTRGVGTAGLSVSVATALAVVLTLSNPAVAWTALARLADPFGRHDWPRQTQLQIEDFRPRVARGEPYEIHALVSGVVPEHAEIEYEGISPAVQTCRIKITRPAPIDLLTR